MERYEAYKDSGIEWIGEIPEEWNLHRAKAFFTTRRTKGNTELVQLAATQDRGMIPQSELDSVVQVSEDADLTQFRTVRKNDFVISLRSFQGGFELSQYEGVCSPAYQVFYGNGAICTSYFKYLFKSDAFISKMNSLTVGIREGKNIQFQDFANSLLAFPPITEQQAIADYLDAKTTEIDALVADCEREVELLQEYRKAVVSEAVTKGLNPDAPMKDSGIEWIGEIPDDWEVVGFKTYLNGIIDYRGRTPEKVDDGVFLITGRNIKQGRIHYELSQEYMRPEDFDSIMSRGRLKVGNVLFTMEAPLGEVALIDRNDCAAAQRIIQLCCNEDELLGAFLVYWIMSDQFQNNLQTYATGSTASGIKASKLGMLRLMHPPMETQHSIVDYLDAKTAEIDSLIDAKQHMADKLREYRRSLISEAVTGKFKVPGVE